MAIPEQPRLGFIGAGHVASVLGLGLAQQGYAVTAVASRRGDSARLLAERLAGCTPYSSSQAVADHADLTFVAVPDDTIGDVVSQICWRPAAGVIHCSGALGLEPLLPAATAGASTGLFHPLQLFASPRIALESLPGSAFAIEGDAPLLFHLEKFAYALGGQPVRIPESGRALYHVAATFVCASVVTLLHEAASLWSTLGLPRDEAQTALLSLLTGTVATLGELCPSQALAGPIARGDLGTVHRHIADLAVRAPESLDLYRVLAQHTVSLAEEAGSIDASHAAAIRNLIAVQPTA